MHKPSGVLVSCATACRGVLRPHSTEGIGDGCVVNSANERPVGMPGNEAAVVTMAIGTWDGTIGTVAGGIETMLWPS